MRKLKFALTAAVVILAVAVLALPAAASTGSRISPAPTAGKQAMAGPSYHAVEYRITTKYGTLTYGWRPLTSGIVPRSASGCNQDVCISIIGSSNHVSDWSTTAYWDGGYICTHSNWDINNVNIRTGNGACGSAGVFFSDWRANRYFPSPSLACNWWQRIPGYPCETIRR